MEQRNIDELSPEELKAYAKQLNEKVFKDKPLSKFKEGDNVFIVRKVYSYPQNKFLVQSLTILKVLSSKRYGIRYNVCDYDFNNRRSTIFEKDVFATKAEAEDYANDCNAKEQEQVKYAKLRSDLHDKYLANTLFPLPKYSSEQEEKLYKEVAQELLTVKAVELSKRAKAYIKQYKEYTNSQTDIDAYLIKPISLLYASTSGLIQNINDCNSCITAWFGKEKCVPVPDFSKYQKKIKSKILEWAEKTF